jgi:hypothetical protein
MENAMHPDRLAEWQEPIENCEDPADRADPAAQTQSERCGTWNAPLDDYEDREMWRRILAACIQPLPDAAD